MTAPLRRATPSGSSVHADPRSRLPVSRLTRPHQFRHRIPLQESTSVCSGWARRNMPRRSGPVTESMAALSGGRAASSPGASRAVRNRARKAFSSRNGNSGSPDCASRHAICPARRREIPEHVVQKHAHGRRIVVFVHPVDGCDGAQPLIIVPQRAGQVGVQPGSGQRMLERCG